MKHIFSEDYILWDVVDNCNVEDLFCTYHYAAVIENFNRGLKLDFNQEYVRIKDLPIDIQKRISDAIELEISYL